MIHFAELALPSLPVALETDNTDYIFKPGQLPVQRQMYYQLCDLHSDDLQEIIHSNDGREQECTVSMCALTITYIQIG